MNAGPTGVPNWDCGAAVVCIVAKALSQDAVPVSDRNGVFLRGVTLDIFQKLKCSRNQLIRCETLVGRNQLSSRALLQLIIEAGEVIIGVEQVSGKGFCKGKDTASTCRLRHDLEVINDAGEVRAFGKVLVEKPDDEILVCAKGLGQADLLLVDDAVNQLTREAIELLIPRLRFV